MINDTLRCMDKRQVQQSVTYGLSLELHIHYLQCATRTTIWVSNVHSRKRGLYDLVNREWVIGYCKLGNDGEYWKHVRRKYHPMILSSHTFSWRWLHITIGPQLFQ